MSVIWGVSPDGGCEMKSYCDFTGEENCRHSPLPPADYVFSHFIFASDKHGLGIINKTVVHIVRWWNYVADYPGEDFYAWIWFQDGKFLADIHKDHQSIGIENGETAENIVIKIATRYGNASDVTAIFKTK